MKSKGFVTVGTRPSRIRRTATAALFLLLAGAANGWAEDASSFPTKSIRVIVPFAPGGAADIVVRTIVQAAGAEAGWSFYVENISGAGGLVGAQAAARAAPDGYTLLLCNISCAANQYLHRELNWDPKSALAPVIALGNLPNVLVVGPSVKGRTLKQIVEDARNSPDHLQIATSGPGSSSSLAAELLAIKAGIEIKEIPYRGSSAATPDLLAGRVDGMLMGLPESLALIRGAGLRGIGVTSTERAPSLPDVPTISEGGVPGYKYLGWLSLFTQKAVPDAIVGKLNAGFNKVLASKFVLKRFSEMSIEPVGGAPGVAGRLLDEDLEALQPILTEKNQ